MKYFTLLLLSLATLTIRAQYVDLLQSDTTLRWLAAHDNTSLSGTTHTETAEYLTGRTVTINSQQYKETYNGLQNRHLREDAQHNIYGLDPNDTVETLLFAFNAQVGDTIRFRGFIGDSTRQTRDFFYAVDSIGTADVNGSARRAIHVSTDIPSGQAGFYIPLTWIEGIGEARYGLHSVFVSDLYNGYSFCGVYQNNAYVYAAGGNCNLLTSITTLQASDRIRLYPAPARDVLTIENNSSEQLTGYRLIDVTGSNVSEGSLTGQKNSISVGNLSAGVYFVCLKDAVGHTYSQRIVKQ